VTRSVLIVGAGPAAAGAALAAARHPEVDVTILDIGGRLEDENERARARLAAVLPAQWDRADVDAVGQFAVAATDKRALGSDFPFRNYGQLDGLTFDHVNPAISSGAYGGFSNIWGAQVMPFTSATFRRWPVAAAEMNEHYRSVLDDVPFAAQDDDLADLFPLLAPADDLPPLSRRSETVLARYARHRQKLNRAGVLVGRARLAMRASECVRCGLCLTGCPYSLIYSASQTLSRLRGSGRVTYHDGLLAVRVEETEDGAAVVARELGSGRLRRFEADRVLLACGAIGTTRLALGSLQLFGVPVSVAESAQMILPFLSRRPVADPRGSSDFTLNQFNMVVNLDAQGYDVSQLHFYTYSSAFENALPSVLRSGLARGPRRELLRRLSVALGYLPSWASPDFMLRAHPAADDALPELTISAGPAAFVRNRMLRGVLRRLTSAAPYLDLWPLLPLLEMAGRGKSYHWGATFPHSEHAAGRLSSDVLGRVAPWTRIHLIDASVFPSVPATTFTLTIMANAHRIMDTTLKALD